MILGMELEGVVVVQAESYYQRRRFYEVTLVSEDSQTLNLFEGQLKEVGDELEIGGRYRIVFRPFLNNYWVELKVSELTRIE